MTDETNEGAAKPAARFTHPGKTVALTYPVEFDGKTWTEVHVRPVGAMDLKRYFAALAGADDDTVAPVWVDCPVEVWNALFSDDQDAIGEVIEAFTPARLKTALERASENGEPTSQS